MSNVIDENYLWKEKKEVINEEILTLKVKAFSYSQNS